jgi:hypothetical protein
MNVVFKNQNTETISLFKSDFSRSINGLQKIRVKKWGMSWKSGGNGDLEKLSGKIPSSGIHQ